MPLPLVTPGTNRLLLQRLERDYITPGGIEIPHYQPPLEIEVGLRVERENSVCKVLAVGTCRTRKGKVYDPGITEGDIVAVDPYAGSTVDALTETCGERAFVTDVDNVLAIFEETTDEKPIDVIVQPYVMDMDPRRQQK